MSTGRATASTTTRSCSPRSCAAAGGRDDEATAAGALRRRAVLGRSLRAGAREELKLRVLDALGCALGALDAPPVRGDPGAVREFGGRPLCTLIGGGRSAPDRAALYNGALVRYLDFNDSYFAPGETCHPSDNLAPVLAAAEYARRLRARAADRARGRLPGAVPPLRRGAGAREGLRPHDPGRVRRRRRRRQGARARRGADRERDRDRRHVAERAARDPHRRAVALEGARLPVTAFGAVDAAFLAMRGVTGPPEVFEGNKGFIDAIAGPFEIDWEARGPRARPAHHPQALQRRDPLPVGASRRCSSCAPSSDSTPSDVERIELDTFQVAYDIIGGGEEGDKKRIADARSRPTTRCPTCSRSRCSTARCMPEQFAPERIVAPTCRSCCGASRCARPPTCPPASRPSTPAGVRLHLARRRARSPREKSRLRGLPHPPDGLGARRGEKFERARGAASESSPSSRPRSPRRSPRLDELETPSSSDRARSDAAVTRAADRKEQPDDHA